MAEGMNRSRDDGNPEASEEAGKRSHRNILIFACVFLLALALPSAYKAFAPFLFLIPIIIDLVGKMRQAGKNSGDPSSGRAGPPPPHERIASLEPYSYKPKDPGDPRRYKPIG